jgi:hypothetical protein
MFRILPICARLRATTYRSLLRPSGAALATLIAFGCSDGPTATQRQASARASMSVRATISAQTATQVLLVAIYFPNPIDTSAVDAQIDAAGLAGAQLVDLTSATSQSVPMLLDLSECLADSRVSHKSGGCPYVYVAAFLLTGQNKFDLNDPSSLDALNDANILDVDAIGPYAVTPGATVTASTSLVLHEVFHVRVTAAGGSTEIGGVTLGIGQSVSLSASALDANLAPVTGRTVTWASRNTSVATVSSTGLVTGIAPGSTTLTASAGGRTTVLGVIVQSTGLIPPVPIAFTVQRGSSQSSPSGFNISITSTGGTSVPVALTAPTTSYGAGASGWLSVSLSPTTTPATLTVIPINTASLPIGTFSAVITVRPVNSALPPVTVNVTMTVR